MLESLSLGLEKFSISIIIGLILFIFVELIIIISKKRSIKDLKEYPKFLIFSELLLSIYICVILSVTGVMGNHIFSFSNFNIGHLLSIPFLHSDLDMIILNFFLFVPYGFLVHIVFIRCNINSIKAFIIGFSTSLIIELIQSITNRLAEIDDLIMNTTGFIIGYLIVKVFLLFRKKEYKKALSISIITLLSAFTCFIIIYHFADGKNIEDEQNNSYQKYLANKREMKNSDEQINAISQMNAYIKGEKKDCLTKKESYNQWYNQIGSDIDFLSECYTVKSYNDNLEKVFEPNKHYIEIIYNTPQTFNFDNPRLRMIDINHLIICLDNGNIWYNSSQNSHSNFANYDKSKAKEPIIPKKDLVKELEDTFK